MFRARIVGNPYVRVATIVLDSHDSLNVTVCLQCEAGASVCASEFAHVCARASTVEPETCIGVDVDKDSE
jgi:hypothetical protein